MVSINQERIDSVKKKLLGSQASLILPRAAVRDRIEEAKGG